MKDMLRKLVRGEKAVFSRLCVSNNLTLDYTLNQAGVHIATAIFKDREYADFFPFQEEATVVDIGAHYGYFSLFARQHLAAQGRVFAVEPSEANCRILRANLTANGMKDVAVYALAIAASESQRELFLGRSENNSLVDEYPLLDGKGSGVMVKTMTLDGFMQEAKLASIDFLKLDCEGAEYEILLGASDETLSRITTISMEFHDLMLPEKSSWQLVDRLRSAGFAIVKYQHEPTNRNLNYGKLIATRRLS